MAKPCIGFVHRAIVRQFQVPARSQQAFCQNFNMHEDVPLLEFKYLVCHMRVAVGDSGLCCCVCVTSFER